jgi:hypothetical protein
VEVLVVGAELSALSFPVDLPLSSDQPDPTFVIARAVDTDNPSSPSAAYVSFPDWVLVTQGGRRFLRIRNVGGLASGHVYSLSFAAF